MTSAAHTGEDQLLAAGARVRARLNGRSIVLVGMMGAGKSSVGRRLAKALNLPFIDADTEIEKAASMSISDIFATRGEPEFRAGERRVVARLLDAEPTVIATGGGAFMDEGTREKVRARGISVWLKADVDVLLRRVKKRGARPLLKAGDPEQILRELLIKREPVYAGADVTVFSREVPHEAMVAETLARLIDYLEPEEKT